MEKKKESERAQCVGMGELMGKTGTVTHDNKLSPGDDEIKKISVSSVTSVAKSNFMAVKNLDTRLMKTVRPG